MFNPLQIILGVLLAALVAYAAYRVRSLNRSGALAAFLLGVVVFGFGGLPWAVVLLTFFITSSGLSRLLKHRKKEFELNFAKGARRDAGQVAANGGLAGLAALASIFWPQSVLPWVLFSAAFAAANADTWATELGVFSRRWPRSIRTWQCVSPGTSGGVSLAGSLAAACGAALIAFTTWLVWPVAGTSNGDRWLFALIIALAGLLGSFVDSLLGATVQGIYLCPVCHKETEKHPFHTCGNETILIRGWKWMNNDVVNLLCTASGALIAWLLTILVY